MRKKFQTIKIHKIKKERKNKNLSFEIVILSKVIKIIIIIFISIFLLRCLLSKKTLNYNYIHLAVNFDNKYIYPCLVYLTSLLCNKAESSFYIIHLLTGNDIINGTFDKINKTIETFGKNSSNVSYYNLGEQFKGATSGPHISTAAYYRISLPSLLPDVDKVIYTDTDIINFKDLSGMYNLTFNNETYFYGTLDNKPLLGELESLGVHADKYINTGVMLINLKALRNGTVENDIRKFVSSHFLNHHEQTAINSVCYKNMQTISYKYARFAFYSYEQFLEFNNKQDEKFRYNESELNQSFYDPIFLHYAGYDKPWDRKFLNTTRIYWWWYYAKKSIYYQEILDNYGFKNEEIEDLLNNSTQHWYL